jgi:hypothetical protein
MWLKISRFSNNQEQWIQKWSYNWFPTRWRYSDSQSDRRWSTAPPATGISHTAIRDTNCLQDHYLIWQMSPSHFMLACSNYKTQFTGCSYIARHRQTDRQTVNSSRATRSRHEHVSDMWQPMPFSGWGGSSPQLTTVLGNKIRSMRLYATLLITH